ncbi:hypothetical protein [Paenibacillus sp. 8b26]|uniref:hypothetical protein n=1 Tax=Paenibacillus sp. 8b26 TaxID=3424133 RepID=UPI003D64EA18
MEIVQQRIIELEAMRNRLEVNQLVDGTWDWFLEREICEMKNARRLGRTLDLRTRLKSLVLLILSPSVEESKGERI